MRAICLSSLVFAGCSTMSIRTGLVVVGGEPSFQVSLEAGGSTSGRRHGMSATYEVGAESGAHTQGFAAMNVDHYVKDGESLPIARLGARVRGGFSDDSYAAFELRGTAFTGLARHRKTGSGGLGVEIAGGIALDPQAPIFEANLVLHRRWNLLD